LFVATTINYVDRQVLGILAPTLQRELHWTESDYGDIVSWFSFAMRSVPRRWPRYRLDRVRRGLGIAVVAWSVAAIGHAFAKTAAGFSFARAALRRERVGNLSRLDQDRRRMVSAARGALATGIFNAEPNMVRILRRWLFPWIALRWGWQWAFVATGALGFCAPDLIRLYRNSSRTGVSVAESRVLG